MASIAHRSPRHARINGVYTPPSLRRQGYASAIVAGLCSIRCIKTLVLLQAARLPTSGLNMEASSFKGRCILR
ncbi:GNAT family N-acetyltransferase [Paenibacillus caui]|uniref:GNAT family N-acetyltransferase n=1 Tax=Paenibacillus caui TaxID=2873927 RepID=UPI001F37D5E3|nr:hypothetical protein [Paenibacillus caui]